MQSEVVKLIPKSNDGVKPVTADDVIRRLNDTINKNKKTVELIVDELNKTNASIENYVKALTKDIGNLQDQVDGNITTWFYSGVPSLENKPSSDWTTDNEKIKHIGDLYYDQNTGYAYRFNYDNSTNIYNWLKITDSDVTEALAIANSAQDTADRKRQNFVVTPYTPYDVGDFWIKDNKDLYRCQTKRTSGDFNSSDWCKATDYSNDDYAKQVEAVLNDFKTTVETDYVTNVKFNTTKESIEASVETVTTQITKIENDVSQNKTETDNKISDVNNKLNDYATVESVKTISNRVEENVTATEKNTEIITKIEENGVTKVDTKTGFTMDADGFHVDKSGAPTSSIVDETGMEVVDKTTNETIQFSGYVDDAMSNKVSMLNDFLNQTVSYSKSLLFSQFLRSNNFRIEEIEDETHGKGLGIFYVGGD
jgi:hypothetical protein